MHPVVKVALAETAETVVISVAPAETTVATVAEVADVGGVETLVVSTAAEVPVVEATVGSTEVVMGW